MASLSGNSAPLLATARRLPTAERKLAAARATADGGSEHLAARILCPAAISAIVHALLLIACHWWLIVPRPPARAPLELEATASVEHPQAEVAGMRAELAASTAGSGGEPRPQLAGVAARLQIAPPPRNSRRTLDPLLPGNSWLGAPASGVDPLAKAGGSDTSELAAARSGSSRRLSIRSGGASEASESAVDQALVWIVEHQTPDGGWSFEHRQKACKGECSHPGTLVQARVAATSLALLPLLGAGYTHKQGKYKKAVQGGLAFLGRNMRLAPAGGDLQAGGMMYSQALATLALCEAFAMTKDRQVGAPAQAALNFIVSAQDPQGGGWRYAPGMPGDTSVFGWQLMALKSGRLGYLNVPPQTIAGASRFLDSVARDDAAQYGYTPGQDRGQADHATTAIGLLSRMLLGWKRDDPKLARGVELLAGWGPSNTDLYYDYYATQVMRHYGGERWLQWNEVLRDRLVEMQARRGHEAGSWYVADPASDVGGRLYCTAMCTMILEVYYRWLPLYQKRSTGESF